MTDLPDPTETLPPAPPTIASIVQQQIDDAQAEATACRGWADQYSARAAAAEARVAQLQALSG